MHQLIHDNLRGDLIVSTGSHALQKAVSQATGRGELLHLVSNIYARAKAGSDRAAICRQHLWQILGLLFPGAVISHRTALEFLPHESGVVLTYRYRKTYHGIPGLSVYLLEGPGPIEDVDPAFAGGLFVSGAPRVWLENLGKNRRRGFPFRLGQTEVERRIENHIQKRGIEEVRRLLDRAQEIAPTLGRDKEAARLKQILADLEAKPSPPSWQSALTSNELKARRGGLAYSTEAVATLSALHAALAKAELPRRLLPEDFDRHEASNLAFIDAYFSNYIEGTRFEPEEARDIVFHERIPHQRPEGHDVLGTYKALFRNLREKTPPPVNRVEFTRHIRLLHEEIMTAHEGIKPGSFKDQKNFAGTSEFVAPELIEGTLEQALAFVPSLLPGMARALFLKFLLSEIHPFLDGNGRVSRAVMNQELVSQGEVPIVIPTVFRIDYMGAVKAVTKSRNTVPFIRAMDRAQAFTATIPLASYEEMMGYLTGKNAFSDDPNDVLRF